jgi:hypothetical protein
MTFTLQEFKTSQTWGVDVIWHGHELDADTYALSFTRQVELKTTGLESEEPKIKRRIKHLQKKGIYLPFSQLLKITLEAYNGNNKSNT